MIGSSFRSNVELVRFSPWFVLFCFVGCVQYGYEVLTIRSWPHIVRWLYFWCWCCCNIMLLLIVVMTWLSNRTWLCLWCDFCLVVGFWCHMTSGWQSEWYYFMMLFEIVLLFHIMSSSGVARCSIGALSPYPFWIARVGVSLLGELGRTLSSIWCDWNMAGYMTLRARLLFDGSRL